MKCTRILMLLFVLQAIAFSQASPNSTSKQEKPKSQTPQNEKADSQTGADRSIRMLQVTWDQFLDDYEPAIRSGSLAALMPMSLYNKYGDKQVIWTGAFKALFEKDNKAQVVIGMKPRRIPHRDGNTTLDFLMSDVDPSEVEKWKALKPGDTIRFRINLGGFVFAVRSDMMRSEVQDLRDGSTPVVVLFSVSDARIVTQTVPSKTETTKTTTPPPQGNDLKASQSAGSNQAPASQQLEKRVTIDVLGQKGWTNTSVLIKSGERIRITAEGTITLDTAGQKSGPEGVDLPEGRKLMESKPMGALIAVVGANNIDFIFIGKGSEFIARKSGWLFLSVNDDIVSDNTGSYRVTVEVRKAQE